MVDQVEGQVARILSSQELVLNKGTADGIVEGQYIAILPDGPEVLKDPVTGTVIGQLSHFKAALRVEQASENFSIAATYKMHSVNIGGRGMGGFRWNLEPQKWVDRVESFEFEDNSVDENEIEVSVVRVGDNFMSVDKAVADRGYK